MKLTQDQAKQIRALKSMKDEDIDFTDIPEKTDWSGAVVGKFYRADQEVSDDSEGMIFSFCALPHSIGIWPWLC
jgi:hypothetical protein